MRVAVACAAVLAVAAASLAQGASADRIVVVGRSAIPPGVAVWRGSGTALRPARLIRRADSPALSYDGRLVATATPLPARRLEIRVAPVGGARGRLVDRLSATTTSLAFSRDGKRLAHASPRGIELFGLTAPGRRALRLPLAWRGSTYSSLAFSPDGAQVAFTRTSGDGRNGTLRSELAVAAVDGSAARRLYRVANPFSEQARPTFSPDGSRIAFVVGERAIFTVAVTGGPPTRLTTPPPRSSDGDPVYSPDGEWLAFPRTPQRGVSDVWLVRADGTGVRRLTTTPIPPRGEPHTGSQPLVWSPDGGRILAFRHNRFATVDVDTRESFDVRVTGVRYSVGPARWVS